jgi:choice-of-anchor A domain-containing protein
MPVRRSYQAAVAGAFGVLGLAAIVTFGVAAPAANGAVTGVAPLDPPLGPCSGPDCPGTFPPPHNGNFAGRDASINIFAGGDFTAQQRAAEAEGKVVVLGSMRVNKNGGGIYNVGVVGVGSRVPPPNGSDFVVVGKDLTVEPNNTLEVGGSDLTTTAWGNVRYGGTTSGNVSIVPSGRLIHDPNAADPYQSVLSTIEDRSNCAAEATATGAVVTEPSQVTFSGDGTSSLQVFNYPGNIGNATSQTGIVFTNIPAGATVLVNMTGTNPIINTYTGTGNPGDQLTDLRPRLMWNFPNADSALVAGSAQFQGSIMAAKSGATVTLRTPGINGRVYVAGSIVTEGSGGYELHAYPFDGDLPVCSEPTPTPTTTTETPTPTPTVTPTPTETPTVTPTPTPTVAPTVTPTVTPTTSGSPTTSTAPVPSSGWPGATTTSPGRHTALARTGSSTIRPLAIAAAILLAGGTFVALVPARRNRRH